MAESTRQREAFNAYWALGAERSVERLHAQLGVDGRGPSLRSLYGWSARFHWQARIADLERAARVADDTAHIAALREMSERHAQRALLLQQRAAEWLMDATAFDLKAATAIRALVEGAKLERLARGEVNERIEQREAIDARLEVLNDDELDRLIDHVTRGLEGASAP